MGAIFFYIFIYFVGYYGSNLFNMFTVRPLVTNRFLAALVPVVGVAILHGYMIVTKPPPATQDITVESALFSYVVMPVIIVTLGAVYFMWNSRKEQEEASEANQRAAEEERQDSEDYNSEALEEEVNITAEKSAEEAKSGEPDKRINETKESEQKNKNPS